MPHARRSTNAEPPTTGSSSVIPAHARSSRGCPSGWRLCLSTIAWGCRFRETCRVEPSEEIRRIVERFTRASATGDHEAALGRLSEHAGTLIIGNDPGEWWHGDEARAIWQRQLEEIGGFPVVTYEVEAWE